MVQQQTRNRKRAEKIVPYFFFVLMVLLTQFTHAQNPRRDTVVFGSDSNFPPYEFLDAHGKPVGFHIDLMRAIANEMGFIVKFKLGDWSEIRHELEVEGTVHVSDMFYSAKRDESVDYAIPHEVNFDEIYIRKSQKGINSLADLKNKKVAVQASSTMQEYLMQNHPYLQVIATKSEPAALLLLSEGKCDAALASHFNAKFTIAKLKLKNIKQVGEPVFPREYSFVVKQGNKEMLKLVNTGLFRIKGNGRYASLYENWFEKPSGTWSTQKLIIALGILTLIIILFLSWIISLRYLIKRKTRELEYSYSRLRLLSNVKTDRIDKFSTKEQTIKLLKQVKSTFNVDACILRTIEKDQLKLMGTVGIASDIFPEFIPVTHIFAKQFFISKKAIAVHDYKKFYNPDPASADDIRIPEYKSFALAPMITDGRISGLLGLYFKDEDAEITDIFLEHLQIVADQIGIYIENNRLFDQNEKQKEILVRQIVSRKKAEVEIIKINSELEQRVADRTAALELANKELEAFSYSVSHDLRAPLRHISGFISLFLDNKTTQLTEEERGYLDIVSKSTDEMGNLIDALLSFSKLNRTELRKTTIDTRHMIKQGLQLFTPEIEARAIELQIPLLPDSFGDYQLISQVWINLISNSIKYTRKKEQAVIEIGSIADNGETVFFVKDNGAGFNMKYADKLFRVFQRLHKQQDFDGIGIGLANINRIVSRHGGRCWAEGETGKGATFYFSLPLEEKSQNTIKPQA